LLSIAKILKYEGVEPVSITNTTCGWNCLMKISNIYLI